MTVTLDQLKDRAAWMEARCRQFEEKAASQNGKVSLHESWRHEYVSFPYLLGAPDDRLASRFKDIFNNVIELSEKSQIVPLPISSEHAFMAKFTHLQEEYGIRTGGIPHDAILREATAPARKYFANGDPVAAKIFAGYSVPPEPFTVKYGQRQHLEPMLRTGRIRISPASFYNDHNHNAAVRDDEIHRTFFIPTFHERLKGIHHTTFQGSRLEYGDDYLVLPVEAPNYFLLSLCDGIHYRMPTDFDADAALIIRDPQRFAQRVISSFLARYPRWKPHYGAVTYYDPYRDFTKIRVHQMSKHFGYAYQREVRIVMEAYDMPRQPLQPEFLDIGPMVDYAELLTA